jgi:predicted secreted protein
MPALSSDPPPELHLRQGETFRCPLRGAGAAGYDWRWTIDGDPAAIAVAVEPSPNRPTVGSIGLILVVRGVHPGIARLNMVLARPARSSAPPLQSFSVAVTIS